ncbi:MAG TPA: phosphatidylserine decarboxylase, partial [Gemmataceae bacterium]|nr:phosphatidylserine decarboxylase [Gemmataceae bacterium]
MAGPSTTCPLPPPEAPQGVQPGGVGFFVRCELAWGRLRRGYLRRFRPAHVARWRQRRQGKCPGCPHDVIDPRDLKFVRNVCGYLFRPEDDVYAYREQLGFARWGYAELVGFTTVLVVLGGLFLALAYAFPQLAWVFAIANAAAWLLIAEAVWFFRDPPRVVPTDPAALVSPADGTVSHIETVEDSDFAGGRALRVSIFLSIFNVHVNRVPRNGRVTDVRYFRGEYLDARHADCAARNEQLWIDMTDAATGQPIRVKQIAGAIARRIVCVLKPGDEVKAGERFGMIKFGSRTDVLVPATADVDVLVKVGDK